MINVRPLWSPHKGRKYISPIRASEKIQLYVVDNFNQSAAKFRISVLKLGDVSTTPHPHSHSSAKLRELRQCGASRTKRAILAYMGFTIAIRKCWSVIPIFFCCFLPPSSSPPHPSSTPAALSLLYPPRPRGTSLRHSQYCTETQRCVSVLRLSSAITDQLTPAPPIQLIIAAVRKK
jgi:hypothetical protein